VRFSLLLLVPLLVGFDLLHSPNPAVEQGNARLKAGKADEALGHYDQAVKSLAVEPGVHFDRGAALFALSRFDEAVQEFLRATEAKVPALKAAAFYNLGNGLFKQDKFGDAVAAYRRSLGIDPSDMRAKWNLELALKKKRDQDDKDKQQKDKQSQNDKKKQDSKDQKNQQNDGKDKQDQDQKDQQAKKDPDKQKDQPPQPPKDEQAKNDNKQGAEDKDKDKDKSQKEPGESAAATPPPPSDDTPDMREIEAVLDNLERNPKDLEKERARARAVRRAPPRKNW
jgi:Ca-activated chloride channel family protein